MLNWYLEPRHWSPSESYVTGDALIGLLRDGWQITRAERAPGAFRAPMYFATLERDAETMRVLVLDGPVVRELLRAPRFAQQPALAAD
ncbi:MAG: hypothetical protein WBH90_10520 [Aggregatilineales bacterium]|nr:hypothetical protein [Aggregatilineales bacterium]HPV06066.1 hypothetical protein [Aggregatilineales bacterium]HQE17793.1 hypothetical protein [Aggregatilineales bacterium]